MESALLFLPLEKGSAKGSQSSQPSLGETAGLAP